MNNSIKFSVIIPAYNAGAYIHDAIESVLSQTYSNYEIIVVDDNSTDETSDVVSRLALKENRIKLYRQTNGKGVSDARNLGMEKATGDYYLFLDADDFFTKKYLMEYLTEVIVNTDADIVHFGYSESISRMSEVDREKCALKYCELNYDDVVRRTIFMSNREAKDMSLRAASPCTKAYKAAYVNKHHIMFPSGVKNSEDAIFNLRLLKLKPSMTLLKLSAYHYWNNSQNSCSRYMPEFKDDLRMMLRLFGESAAPFLKVEGVSDRLNLRYYSYIDKVLRQYFFHKETTTDKTELKEFLNTEDITLIASRCKLHLMAKTLWPIVIGIRMKSQFLLSFSFNVLPRIKLLIR